MEIPAVLARGGSSRGLLILDDALAGLSETQRLAAFAHMVGSPDPDARQVNGVGGGNATTSKVATVARSTLEGHDVDYRFFQVIVATGESETRGTCMKRTCQSAGLASNASVPAMPSNAVSETITPRVAPPYRRA